MNRIHRPAAVALLVLTSGCILPSEPARSVAANVEVRYVAPVGSAHSVDVQAMFHAMEGERVRFRSDTLWVENVIGTSYGRGEGFGGRATLDSASLADGVRVRLPVPTVGPVPHADFTIFPAVRSGSPSVEAPVGQDLRLPVTRGTSGTLPAPEFEAWTVTAWRGSSSVNFNGVGPLPSPVIVPATLIPSTGGDTMQVLVQSFQQFPTAGSGSSDPQRTTIRAESRLEWSVRLIP